MTDRRTFLKQSALVGMGTLIVPTSLPFETKASKKMGVQLYSFRDAMVKDAKGTLAKIAALGITEIESASSSKGHYYGLSPKEMQATCKSLGMKLVSGHIGLDDQWEKTKQEAVESGQEYLVCSSMPSHGQTVDNYKKVADMFNKAGEECKALGIKFGYHNHNYEFEKDGDHVLYDVLLDNTESGLVHMEMDLGWVVASGNDPMDYFKRYPKRFPLWHLKDMNLEEKQSTEFGKGGLDIAGILAHGKESGIKHIFIEQEEYTKDPFTSMAENMAYLKTI